MLRVKRCFKYSAESFSNDHALMKRATAREERERAAANRGLHAAPDLETSFMQRAATSRQRSAIFNAITGISGGGRILLRLSVNVRARTSTETSVFHEK